MLRAALLPQLLFAALLSSACSRAPAIRVEARRLDGPRPAQLVLRCRVAGLKPPVKYQWRYAAGIRQAGATLPSDESVVLMTASDSPTAWAECAATSADDKLTLRAAHSLAPLTISATPAAAKVGELVTVRGGGFGPQPADGDGIWLVSARGKALAADNCKGAAWGETAVSACVPTAARGAAWQLRVQVGGDLALAPKPLTVAP
jgi:hypothetical protein